MSLRLRHKSLYLRDGNGHDCVINRRRFVWNLLIVHCRFGSKLEILFATGHMKQSQKYRTYMYSPVESSRFMPMDADLARPAAKPLRIRYEAERCVLGFVYFWCLFWLFVAGWDEFQIKLSVCGPDKGRTWVIFVATGFDEQAAAGIWITIQPKDYCIYIYYTLMNHLRDNVIWHTYSTTGVLYQLAIGWREQLIKITWSWSTWSRMQNTY